MKHIEVIIGLVLSLLSFNGNAKNTTKKPNIIIIMADDLGYADLSCYGSKTIKTPHLDQLAEEGILFSDFHSNGSVCSPTRAALLTGKYQQRVGISGVVTAKHHRHHGLATSEETFAETCKKAGYTTGIFGKWHIGYDTKFNPIHQGFDEYIGYVSGNVDYHSHIDQEGYEDWWNGTILKQEKGYSTDLITNHAVDFITRHKDAPFLLYIPHEAPHGPFQGRNSKADRTIGGENGVDFQGHGSEKDEAKIYKEMVEVMDEGIGQVIQTLKDLNLANNTLVLFCSDNGGIKRVGDNGILKGYKASLSEGGHRVTAIAWHPGAIKPGQISDQQIMTMDLYPTIADIIGTKAPKDLDGISIKNHLYKGQKLHKRDLFWQYVGRNAVRSGNWKLMLPKKDATPMLYNLKSDLSETTDLSNENPKLVKKLMKKIRKWDLEVQPNKNDI